MTRTGPLRFLGAVPAPFSFCRAPRLAFAAGALVFTAASAGLRAAPAAETGRPLLQAFTPRDYRAHQQIWMGVQAPDGTMWFGNSHSVLNYDGGSWRRIEVPTSYVRTLALAADGTVYAGGTDQLGLIEAGPDGFPVFTSLLEKLPAERRQFGVIWSMAATRDAVWFATESLVLRWKDGRFEAWETVNQPRQSLQTVDAELYLHRQGVGLFRFDGRDFTAVSTAPEVAQSPLCTVKLVGGTTVLSTGDGRFFELRNGRLVRRPTPLDALLAKTRHRLIETLPDGTLVFGTTTLGVILADAGFNFLGRVSAANGLESESILSLTADREGGVWVGTAYGVVRLEASPRFSVFDATAGLPRGLIHDLRRHDGSLYAATASGVLRLAPANPATGDNAHFAKIENSPVPAWSLASHAAGLLVADGEGVQELSSGVAPRRIFAAADGVSRLAVLPQHPDRVFVGRFKGANVLRFDAGRWRDEGGIPGLTTEVRSIAEGADGTLWLGTPTRGFLRVVRAPGAAADDWSKATFTAYRENHGLPAGQGWSHVYQIGPDVVFVTDAGTFTFDPAGDRFVVAARFQIAGRHARTQLWPVAVTDRSDRVWAQPDSEETDLPRQLGALTLHPTGPAEFAPLPRKVLERVAFGGARTLAWEYDAAGETVWLGGPDALGRADLGRPATATAPVRVLLRDLALPDGSHRAPAESAKPPRYGPGNGPLTFAFGAARYGTGPGLRYQTRLRGYANEWSPWSPRTEATFTHVWGGPFTFEVRAQDPDGTIGPVTAHTFRVVPPLHLRPAAFVAYGLALLGAVFGFVRWRVGRAEREQRRLEGVVTVRTRELAAARDQAEAANQAKSAFLASMSHELRTPLNGVIGYAQILQADARLAPDQRERLRIVHQSGEHLLHMINDVLDLAKIEAGKLELRVAPFALVELVQDVASAHAAAAATKRLEFRTPLAPGLPAWVEGDAQKLRQVLDNLLGNAVKFTTAGSVTLEVSSIQPDGEPATAGLCFRVTDTGPGIAPADQARLFQPFEQAGPTRPAAPGTGLGLAISRALAERMGGTLALASTPGTGSVFTCTLTLPVCAAPATPGVRPAVTGYRGARRRVLIIDDHAVNRSLLTELLAPLGFICAEAASGEDALRRLGSGSESWPDLMIVDLRMEGLDGLEFTRRARRMPRGGDVRVLLTSASVIDFQMEDGRRAGCDDFLPKPFRAATLVEKIGTLLQLRWHEAADEDTEPVPVPMERIQAAIPPEARGPLREALATGDLEAFRTELARVRAAHPEAAGHCMALEEAAADFQLSRLRQLIGPG